MKKSTFILSLLLAFLGVTATAQTYTGNAVSAAELTNCVKSVDQINPDSYYVLYCKGRGGRYVMLDPSDRLLRVTGSLPTDKTSMFALFKIESVEEDGQTYYTFKVASSPEGQGYYIPAVNAGGKHYAGTTAAKYSITVKDAENGYFIIKLKGSNNKFNCDDATFTGWTDEGDNGQYRLVPVTRGSETYSNYAVTYSIKVGEEVKESGSDRAWGGETYGSSLPCSYYYNTPTLVGGNNVVGDENTDFVYTTTLKSGDEGTIPVTFSTAVAKKWYNVQIVNSGTRTVKAVQDGQTWQVSTVVSALSADAFSSNYANFNNAVWAFVEDGLGVKVYNKGRNQYLSWTSGAATFTNEAAATRFYFASNTNNEGNGFGLWTGTGNKYLNASVEYDGAKNARLGVWDNPGSKTDNGSRFLVKDVDMDIVRACLPIPEANEANENYVTAFVAADKAQVDALLAGGETLEAYDEVSKYLNVASADITDGAYYRIGNVNIATDYKKYISSENIFVGTDGELATAYNANNSIDRVVRRVSATGNFASMLWKLEKQADGSYFVRNANTGCNISSYVSSGLDMPINKASGGSFTFKAVPAATFSGNDGKTMLQILLDGHRINAYNGKDAELICDYANNHDNDPGNYWQLEKVTSVPVSISDALYASVGFPFAVQVPAESGVKAYYATAAADGELTLSEIADGIIPAYTGAILAATAATDVNLAIVTTDKSLDNKLVAATAKRTGFEANANYMLGVDNDSEVKFLQATITTVPANKAYLPATNVTNSNNALAFNFGGESTGIANTLKDNEEVQYFDLNGRVVLYPSNGVFITNTGKKVFIK